MFTHSIRWRLQLWLAFLLVCVLSGFGITVYQLQRMNQFSQIDEELELRVAALDRAVRGGMPPGFGPGRPPFGRGLSKGSFEEGGRRPPPFRGKPDAPFLDGPPPRPKRDVRLSTEVAGLFDESRTNSFYFAAWHRDGALMQQSTNAPPDVPIPERFDRDTQTHTRTRESFREAYHFTEMGECVLAGRSIVADLRATHRFAWWLLAAGAAVLALAIGGGWRLTTRAIRPVEEISAAARRISEGNLSERIRVKDPENELGRLAGVLNSTFARLEVAFAQQKQFTADASHELRTPLTVLISEAQTTLARERSAAEYRETVETCLDTAQQMRRLTESLLELARLDAGLDNLQRAPLDLAETTRACVDLIRPLASQRGIKVSLDLKPAELSGNADRLAQVATNLLTNAIHYNNPAGEIRVATRIENGHALLSVADSGMGISPEDLPHIFERFYRADKSRSRATGRTGLGLAISRAIVEAHGGTIEVSSEPGIGSAFTVKLPAGREEAQKGVVAQILA
ncbi:MAG: HAMP domain-containing protein [Verrucomicrobia bacterium]|nr:HAMP domain-containing protein [Verrucomicrobiota bacterium]